jgi:tetratricopeptide (TPR) repeat protein
MKTKILSLTVVMALIIMVSGCNWIDSNINIDPTAPAEAPYSTILPTTQVGMAYVIGGDYDRFTSLFTQHHFGTSRQHQNMYLYQLQESDLDNAWNTMYAGPLMDLHYLIETGGNNGDVYYSGIGMILTAVGLGTTTDLLGDIPYTEAFQGNDNLQPAFNTQEQIYIAIQELLQKGINFLSNADGGAFIPGTDDFIYGGDVNKWIKAAWSLKARYALHIKDYANALAYSLKGFESNADDMLLVFGTSETQANPFYQFMQQRGDVSMGPVLMELMEQYKDPRIMPFTSQDSVYEVALIPDGFYTQQNSPIPFMTYAELKFIQAECYLHNSNTDLAYKAYQDAIKANILYFGLDETTADDYVASTPVDVGAANLTLTDIIQQKYIALYYQAETWNDWRRTGLPKITIPDGAYVQQVIRRMVYPQSERLYNGANLKNADGYTEVTQDFIISKMWWDRMW